MKKPMLEWLTSATRMFIAEREPHDPLPPGPNYGPFGYFRVAILILAALIAIIIIANLL